MHNIIDFTFASFLIGCIAVVYHSVLQKSFLSGWFFWGYNHFGKDENSWKYHIYMPVWGCEKCTSGQIALWSFPFMFEYSFPFHVGYIALTIMFSKIITFIYIKTNYDD